MKICIETHRYRAICGDWSGWFSDPRIAEASARDHARFHGYHRNMSWQRWVVIDWPTQRVMAEG